MASVGVDIYYAGDSLHVDMDVGVESQLSFIISPTHGLLHAYYLGEGDRGSGKGPPPEYVLNMFRGLLPEEDYHV